MFYSEREEFVRDLFSFYGSKDKLKAQEYIKELGDYDIWDYKKCYRRIINEYEYNKVPPLKVIKDFRSGCRKKNAKREEPKSYKTVTLRKLIKDRNGKTVKHATYQFAQVDWGRTDIGELLAKGYEKV